MYIFNVNIKGIFSGLLMGLNYFYIIAFLSSNDVLLLYNLYFLSTTLSNYRGLQQKVDKTESVGYWVWAGVTALTATAGAIAYHYTVTP